MRSKKEVSPKSFYLPILSLLKQSTNLKEIQKNLSISKQDLNYYLKVLLKNGLIEKKGRGYYEISKNTPKDTNLPREIRGHAFIWTIKLPKEIKNWDKRVEILEKSNIPFKLIGLLKKTPRIVINNKKVWLGEKSLIIYEPHSFYGINAIESRKYAVLSLISCLQALESKFDINLHPYTFKPSREHYGIIKNDLAIQCNKKGEKIHIRDDLEGEWLWIDDSLELGELETGGTKALLRNIQVQRWWNDMKDTGFKLTPSFLMESINGLIKAQEMNNNNLSYIAQNYASHVEIVEKLSKILSEPKARRYIKKKVNRTLDEFK